MEAYSACHDRYALAAIELTVCQSVEKLLKVVVHIKSNVCGSIMHQIAASAAFLGRMGTLLDAYLGDCTVCQRNLCREDCCCLHARSTMEQTHLGQRPDKSRTSLQFHRPRPEPVSSMQKQ